MTKWQVLLVDDEPDVHSITTLVLKQKRWRNRRFQLTSVYSQAEAMAVLETRQDFHVAILDVVMEKDTSGLELSVYIRDHCPPSMRIVLRTGQPGLAPEEEILNEYDIDYYLAKSDATPGKLYAIVRACIRSSQDISTLLAYGKQLQSFTRTLQSVTSVPDLLVFMNEALLFLELKHSTKTIFNYDIANLYDSFIPDEEKHDMETVGDAMVTAHKRKLTLLQTHGGEELGLGENSFVIPFETHGPKDENGKTATETVLGALVFEMDPRNVRDKLIRDFLVDAVLFIENWCIAFGTLRLRERLAQEQMLRDQMYYERLESIATMVTGVAHELNTPLGVARTANSMVTELADNLLNSEDEDPEDIAEMREDLGDACHLLGKNLDRAQHLIKSFKQLSSSQLSDEKHVSDLVLLVEDCLETMKPDLKKKGITTEVHRDAATDFNWDGYAGHLSQVMINLIQNTIRYAYEADGKIDVFLSREGETFHLVFVDYGNGVAVDILPRLFDPFVTSGRSTGGTGLGMAITHNIITNLLGGSICCESEPGKGARFIIDLPSVVEIDEAEVEARPSGLSKIPYRGPAIKGGGDE